MLYHHSIILLLPVLLLLLVIISTHRVAAFSSAFVASRSSGIKSRRPYYHRRRLVDNRRRRRRTSRRLSTNNMAPASSSSNTNNKEQEEFIIIKNFRPCTGLANIMYRCGKTDQLGDLVGDVDVDDQTTRISSSDSKSGEQIVLYDAGLIIDLRSNTERNENLAQKWMVSMSSTTNNADAPSIDIIKDSNGMLISSQQQNSIRRRFVLRLDPLSPTSFMEYLDSNWLDSADLKMKAALYKVIDGQKLHELRMDVLNQRGLIGLYQAILETGTNDILEALKAITIHLEQQQQQQQQHDAGGSSSISPIVVHCVQGKDRTGLVVMLCQSMLGMSDDDIITCYKKSEDAFPSSSSSSLSSSSSSSSAAAESAAALDNKGKLDRRVFSGAPAYVMRDTLTWIRDRHGSVAPGYLDDIGFDHSWRERFVTNVRMLQKQRATALEEEEEALRSKL